MSPSSHGAGTLFDQTPVSRDDPLWARPLSNVPVEDLVEAARIVTAHPGVPQVQEYRRHVATLRITLAEYETLRQLHLDLEARAIALTPGKLHRS